MPKIIQEPVVIAFSGPDALTLLREIRALPDEYVGQSLSSLAFAIAMRENDIIMEHS